MKTIAHRRSSHERAFTLFELFVVAGVILLLAITLFPAVAKSNAPPKSFQCLNNHRQLMNAWRMYSHDFNDKLAAALIMPDRPLWVTGIMDYNRGNPSNWNTNQDIVKSPLWPYTPKNASIFRCPADEASVVVNQVRRPRVRSYSLSSVFGDGQFLGSSFAAPWRLYTKGAEIVIPAHTFTFVDEHADSINDCEIYSACSGNQPQDPPGSARLIDWPASWHNGGCTYSFADGRSENHQWVTSRMKQLLRYDGEAPKNLILPGAYVDLHWLAANTTVHQ